MKVYRLTFCHKGIEHVTLFDTYTKFNMNYYIEKLKNDPNVTGVQVEVLQA